MVRLGINIDHVATLRQARMGEIPDPVEAAKLAVKSGGDGITAHLREDRRHIQDGDIERLQAELNVPLNMEMAATPEIVSVAKLVRPAWVCLVPEKRRELTTEGGLDVDAEFQNLKKVIHELHTVETKVSLFIDPDEEAVKASKELDADAVELHTGTYADLYATQDKGLKEEMAQIKSAAELAKSLKLLVNAGHGINYKNVADLLRLHPFHEFNIGFAIVSRAVFVGLGTAVKEMKNKLR